MSPVTVQGLNKQLATAHAVQSLCAGSGPARGDLCGLPGKWQCLRLWQHWSCTEPGRVAQVSIPNHGHLTSEEPRPGAHRASELVHHAVCSRPAGTHKGHRAGKCCHGPGPGTAGSWVCPAASVRSLRAVPAGGGAELWGARQVTVGTWQRRGRAAPPSPLYPQAWPRPVLGACLAPLFVLGPPG